MALVSKLFYFLWFFIVITEVFGHLSRPLFIILRLWVKSAAVLFLSPFTLSSSSLPGWSSGYQLSSLGPRVGSWLVCWLPLWG